MVYSYTASQPDWELSPANSTLCLASGCWHWPVTFQLLLPSQGLAIQLQRILRLKTTEMPWMASVWLSLYWYGIGCFFLFSVLFWYCVVSNRRIKVIGKSLPTSWDLPTQSLLFGPTQILPERETRQQINKYWQTDDISESLEGTRVKPTWIMVRLPLSPWTLCFTAN